MAGERLAQQRITVSVSDGGLGPLRNGQYIDIWLAGYYRRFTAKTSPNGPGDFTVFTGSYTGSYGAQNYTVQDLKREVLELITAENLPYNVTVFTETLFGSTFDRGVTIEAQEFSVALDFEVPRIATGGSEYGLSYYAPLRTIRPVRVDVQKTPAGNFGGTNGTITLTPSNGTDGVYSYTWADGSPPVAARTGLRAGPYVCVVRDTSGASTTVTVEIKEVDRLDVLVVYEGNVTRLEVSGGQAPYTFAWADGPTTDSRLNLPTGHYECLVTDAVGATNLVEFDLVPYRFYWSRNTIPLALDAGPAYRADPTLKPNLSFLCEVWVEPVYGSGQFVQVGTTQEQPADRNGRTTFEVQALLDAYVGEHLPSLNQRFISRADSLFRRFYLKYTQRFGSPAVTSASSSTQAQHYVVHGGLDFFEAAANTWFTGYQANAKPFLTWEPNDKKCLPAQPEYLYFMVDSFDLPTFRQWLKVTYSDGSTQETLVEERQGVERYEVYCLPAGFQQLGLTTGRGASVAVHSWEVWVTDAANVPVTQVRRYFYDARYVPANQQRFFLYSTSLGGVSTFAAVGQAKRTLDVKQEVSDRPQNAGYDPLLGDVQVQDKSGQPIVAVSSGPLNREQLVAAQDLALSRRVVMQSGGQYWPGVLKPKAFPVDDQAERLPTLEFEFLLPKQRQFSPRLPVVPANLVVPISGGGGAQP